MSNSKITVKLVKSVIGTNQNQRKIVKGLGLKKLNSEKTLDNVPTIRGMIKKVIHLLEIKQN